MASDTNTRLDGSSFISGGLGHAMELGASCPSEITLTNVSFTSYSGTPGSNLIANSGSVNDAIYNNSGKAITINITGGDTPSIRNGAGATTTVIAGTVLLQITVIDTNAIAISGARVLVTANSGGDLPYQEIVTITRDGVIATVSHATHGLSDGKKVLIKNATQLEYNGVFVITYIDANSYSYTVSGSPATPATGTILASAVIIDDVTNGSGIVNDTRSYSGDQPITGRSRKATGSLYYKTSSVIGTIDSTSGLNLTIQMISDE